MLNLEIKTAANKLFCGQVNVLVVNIGREKVYLHITENLTFWQILKLSRLIRDYFPNFRILVARNTFGMYEVQYGTTVL